MSSARAVLHNVIQDFSQRKARGQGTLLPRPGSLVPVQKAHSKPQPLTGFADRLPKHFFLFLDSLSSFLLQPFLSFTCSPSLNPHSFSSLSLSAALCVSPRFCPYSVTRSTKKDYVLSNNWITSTSLCQRPGAMCVLTDFQVCRCCSPF